MATIAPPGGAAWAAEGQKWPQSPNSCWSAALLGALDNPAIYEISGQEETLAQLLAYSGGLQILTTPHKVLVERINTGPGKAPRSVEERALTTEGLNSTVRDGDLSGYREAEADTCYLSRFIFIHLRKGLEDIGQVIRRDADAVIDNLNFQLSSLEDIGHAD